MKGCVLRGKVAFQDGVVPDPVWPAGIARIHLVMREVGLVNIPSAYRSSHEGSGFR
jgi:hypothetical protein